MKRAVVKAMKRFYPTLIITVFVVIGVIVLIPILKSSSLGDLFDFDFFKKRTTIDHGAVILEAIKKQAKLETIAMLERTDNTAEIKEGWCVDRVRYFGLFTVTAGIDLQEITESDIVVTANPDQSQTVTVTLPPATILHAEPDIANDKVVKEIEVQAPWLCTHGSQMANALLEAQIAAKEDAKNAALKAGILEKAEEHAGVVLQELLKNAKYPNVVIKYSPEGYSPASED